MQLATARVEQYLGLLDTSRSQFFPQAGFDVSATRQEYTGAPFSTYQSVLNVSWELDLWGRIRRATEATQAQLFATEEGRRAVLVSLVANVASNNINLLGLDLQLEIARATEKSYAETLRIFRLRHQYGTISGIELRQIESQQEDALLAISNIKAQIALQENQLSTLLGRNPGPVIRGKTLDTLVPPPLPNVLPLTLLERRPDIRQAEFELIAANARIGEAKAQYFPTVSLSGLLGRQSSELADLFRQDRGIWSLG
ncbi:TolC family protein, partial [bacterium]|nr:TolC family protein [bacterium]